MRMSRSTIPSLPDSEATVELPKPSSAFVTKEARSTSPALGDDTRPPILARTSGDPHDEWLSQSAQALSIWVWNSQQSCRPSVYLAATRRTRKKQPTCTGPQSPGDSTPERRGCVRRGGSRRPGSRCSWTGRRALGRRRRWPRIPGPAPSRAKGRGHRRHRSATTITPQCLARSGSSRWGIDQSV